MAQGAVGHGRHVEAVASAGHGQGVIQSSWLRCFEEYSLQPDRIERPRMLTVTELQDEIEPLQDCLNVSEPEIKRLFSRLVDHDYMVSIATPAGVTVQYRCDESMLEEMRNLGCLNGSIWLEKFQGTNGVGLCLQEEKAVTVSALEHFGEFIQVASCVATPIFGPRGKLLCVLNVTTPRAVSSTSQHLIKAIIESSARRIGNVFFSKSNKDHRILRLSRDSDFSDIAQESRIAIDARGNIVDATRESRTYLRTDIASIIGKPLGEVLPDADPDQWPDQDPIRFHDGGGRSLYALISNARRPTTHAVNRTPAVIPAAARADGIRPDFSDGRLHEDIRIMTRLVDRAVPVMLQGETGVGKSMLARHLYEKSKRTSGRFVSLNCAAIPQDLIEAELFGYKAGAFTGAAKGGARGKIMEADGGVLFLDEVGDMPLHLQTRLLHVLSDGSFHPIGSTEIVKVNVAVISASLRDIPAMVARGTFREDLFHRLNGALMVVPSLRERQDRRSLIQRMFAEEWKGDGTLDLPDEVMKVLVGYSWPGNLRELRHAARYACAVSDRPRLSLDDLPPQFRARAGQGLESHAQKQSVEAEAISEVLSAFAWNVTRAAEQLGVSRATLHRRIAQLGLRRN